jgi:hypothetical protein
LPTNAAFVRALASSLNVHTGLVKVVSVADVPKAPRCALPADDAVDVKFHVCTSVAYNITAVVVSERVRQLANEHAVFNAALVDAGVPTTDTVVIPPVVIVVPVSTSNMTHFFDAATARTNTADGSAVVLDSGASNSSVTLTLSGQASVVNYGFVLDGAPSVDDAHINGITLTGLQTEQNITAGIAVTVTGQYNLPASSAALVEGYSDNHYRHLVNFGGLAAVLHGDKLWVGNTNANSHNCAEGFLLSDASGAAPTWGVDTTLTIAVNFRADGTIHSATANGERLPLVPYVPVLVPVPAACKPLFVPAVTPLYVGASGNEAFNDNFAGRINSFGWSVFFG